MRMWMVDPKLLCRRHLTGEHVETHMFVGTIKAKKSLGGYVIKGLVETKNLKNRHDILANEMTRRGMKHKSELKYEDNLDLGNVDMEGNIAELKRRCSDCKNRMEAANA